MDLKIEDKYMWRALQLARNGEGRVSPNPMVGAVITCHNRIIGEGFHAYYGGPHAEVNAIRSVAESDTPLLKEAIIYVTLEPCAHFGKTPPCANLIVSTGIPKVVIGSLDPNPKVAGKGVKILEDAGVEVTTGVLESECRSLNKRFMKAHEAKRPWILLKWAQSADGLMAVLNEQGQIAPVKFSTPLSLVWMHRERGSTDAIMVGSNTESIDRPTLTTRLWGGKSPKKYVAHEVEDVRNFVENLYKEGITSLMVEGGPTLLKSFLEAELFDEIRLEINPRLLHSGLPAPRLPEGLKLVDSFNCRDNNIFIFRR